MKMESDTLERAIETAQAIIEADPKIGPVEVVYVKTHDEILTNRFALFVNAEAKLYLFDRISQQRKPIHLSSSNFETRLLECKAIARNKRLGTVFVVEGTELLPGPI